MKMYRQGDVLIRRRRDGAERPEWNPVVET